MNEAWIALLGALLGAFAGLGAAWLTVSRQEKTEHKKWLRQQKQQAYSNALRVLSESLVIPIGNDVTEIERWYRNLAKIRDTIVILQVFSSQKQNRIAVASQELFSTMSEYSFAVIATEMANIQEEFKGNSGFVALGVARVRLKLNAMLTEVADSALLDLGQNIKG